MRHLVYVFFLVCPLGLYSQSYLQALQQYREQQLENFRQDAFGPLRKENIAFVEYFAGDTSYKVQARVQPLFGEKTFRMPTYDGTSNPYKRYATLHFTLHGKDYTLTAYQSTTLVLNPQFANYLFVPFMDDSNGTLTYGGGRYLELDASHIQNGYLTIDFNKAYNPYCAYSSGYRCPQPPPENTLPIAILAGEKKYQGPKNERPVNKKSAQPFSAAERAILQAGDPHSKLHVYQVTHPEELRVLTSSSSDIALDDPLLPLLAQRMLHTVQDPAHPGVGLAAPQVGILKNAIWVQRFDKENHPFEFYINPKIIWRSKLLREGSEGCLSIPDRKEEVQRSHTIRIQHWDKQGNIIEENIEGFTAVIFQHEVDHLYGILYPDRVEEQQKQHTIASPPHPNIKYRMVPGSIYP